MINSSGARNGIIYADSAEPKTIAELKQYGKSITSYQRYSIIMVFN
jgi:phage terminase large subunit